MAHCEMQSPEEAQDDVVRQASLAYGACSCRTPKAYASPTLGIARFS
jgi:hypothetical protein